MDGGREARKVGCGRPMDGEGVAKRMEADEWEVLELVYNYYLFILSFKKKLKEN